MDQSRRKFFGIGAAAVAAAAIPADAVEVSKAVDEAVGPIMYEHVCDGGKIFFTPEDLVYMKKYSPDRVWGCGTRFRWYFGVPAVCPNCGWCYPTEQKHFKDGTYKRVS